MNNELIVKSFAPIVSDDTEILILGTVPGKVAIEKNEYYAHSNNKFWQIIGQACNIKNITLLSYNERIKILKQHKIGLWDIINTCERKSSKDKNIKNEKINYFYTFFKKYPNIKKVIFNGKKAYQKYINKVQLPENIIAVSLISTSGAFWDCQKQLEKDLWLKALLTI